MNFSDKIDEWIEEAQTRPSSALMILKLIAGRLRDLTQRNEELLAENIALQDGTRVEEYRKRIAHLEYQLDLLKRRFGTDDTALAELSAQAEAISLLVYNTEGRILRIQGNPAQLADIETLGQITGDLSVSGELPRLLVVPSQEEVLLLFTSGRVSTRPVTEIPAVEIGVTWAWKEATLPDEPHAGELLACVVPLSRLALSENFLQASRKGCVKKTMTSMAQSILSNRFLGRGAVQKADQAFDLTLCSKKERFAMITSEGRLLGLDVDHLSYAAEERIRLEATDHVVASFVLQADESLLCLTQTGKVIQREGSILELSKSGLSRGQALIPPSRLEQGVRFIGAAPVRDADRILALDAEGNLTLHLASDLAGAGSIRTAGLVLAIGVIRTG